MNNFLCAVSISACTNAALFPEHDYLLRIISSSRRTPQSDWIQPLCSRNVKYVDIGAETLHQRNRGESSSNNTSHFQASQTSQRFLLPCFALFDHLGKLSNRSLAACFWPLSQFLLLYLVSLILSASDALGDNVVSALLPLHGLTPLLSGGTKQSPSLLLSRGFQHGPLPGEALKGWGRVAPLTLTAGQPKGIKAR